METGGILHLCDDLLETIPNLTVILTAARGVELPDPLPLGIEAANRPADTKRAAEKFLADQAPDVSAFAGSELPVASMTACRAKKVPMVYLDAQTSARPGLRHWISNLGTGSALRMFHRILAVSQTDANNLANRGADPEKIEVTGALEVPVEGLPCDEEERDFLAGVLGTRPVWLAAGVPLTEFGIIEAAFQSAGRLSHRLLLVVIPAAPEDAAAFAHQFRSKEWVTARRSLDETPDDDVRILIGDISDEEGLWFRLASITYLGGSLTTGPLTDPYAPGALGSAIITGTKAKDPSAREAMHLAKLLVENACRVLHDPTELGATVSDLLAPDRAATLAGKAWDHIFAGLDTKDRAHGVLSDLLEREQR